MQSENQSSATNGFLSGLRNIFRREEQHSSTTPGKSSEFDSVRDAFNSTLKALKFKAEAAQREALRRAQAQKQGGAHTKDSGEAEVRRTTLKRALEVAQEGMRGEIEALHKRLSSGVEASTLTKLRNFLFETAELIEQLRNGDIEARLRTSAFLAAYTRSNEVAWIRFENCLKTAGEAWPVESKPQAGNEQALELERERSLVEARELFLGASPRYMAEWVLGVVPAWKLSYPQRDSWLWKQVALRGVAAGIQAQIFERVVEAVRPQGDAIRKELSDYLAKELKDLNAAIAKAANSIEDLDQLTHHASGALQGIVAEKVLERAKPVFDRELSGAR